MKKIILSAALPVLMSYGFVGYASANNGFYLTGYGSESVMLGGADVAVSRTAFAATNNPSGMSQIQGQSAELEGAFFWNPEG